jgi:hypothetical protein
VRETVKAAAPYPGLPCSIFAGNLTVSFLSDIFVSAAGFTAVVATLCPPGFFSSTGAPVDGACPGVCPRGYACPTGTTDISAQQCAPGSFSSAGAGVCTPCFAGKWSDVSGRGTPCDSDCVAGHFCPAGSASGTAAVCPAGRYSETGAGACTPCAGGTWSDTVGRSNACVSECAVGYACPEGSANGTAERCLGGTFGLEAAERCPTLYMANRFVLGGVRQ